MRAVVALVLVACGSGTPAPRATVAHDDDWQPEGPIVASLEPAPADLELLDIDPDPVDWRRPLPGPPTLVPSAPIAAMFGAKDWTTLCSARRDPRGVDRDEALGYLRAWCDSPPDLALAKALIPLLSASTHHLATAAAIDLATVLESQLAAREALAWLKAQNARSELVLDALAATYLASDRLDDTRIVITSLRGSYGATACRRLFRELFVADRERRDAIRSELSHSRDAVCSRLSTHASCPLSWGVHARGEGVAPARADLDRCTPLLFEKPELMPRAYLTIAVAKWPRSARSFEAWFGFAQFTVGAAGAPRADELIAAAFTNAVRVSNCDAELDVIKQAVATSSFEKVRAVGRLTRSECERRSGSPPR